MTTTKQKARSSTHMLYYNLRGRRDRFIIDGLLTTTKALIRARKRIFQAK